MTSTLAPVRKRSALTKGQLPKYAPYAVLVLALVIGAAILALIGFNAFGWGIVSAILFAAGLVGWSAAVEGSRRAKDRLATCLVVGSFLVALLPLISVIWTVLVNGLPGLLDPGFLTTSMNGVTGAFDNKSVEEGAPVIGGIYHAILGTIQITLLATVISVPVGLLTAVYLVEYGEDRPLARAITFFVDVMTGIPSIVAGLFACRVLLRAVVGPGTKTGAVAAVALSVLMIPVVVRSSEEMLKLVPNELREAAYALGVPKWLTILKVVIPTAIAGIASGVTLAIARVIGETAPLLVTAGFATTINNNVFGGWMASLPTFIYTQILNPGPPPTRRPS